MAITDQTRGLALDLLAWQTQGRIRNSLLSARSVITPESGTISNTQRILAVSEVFAVPLTGIAKALVIRCSALLNITVTLDRPLATDVVFVTNCTGLLVITDDVQAVSITNPSATATVDVSIVTI